MHFDVITLFPELFTTFAETGVFGRAVERGQLGLKAHDLRDWAGNKWKQIDDEPYGGGAGMVIQAGPVLEATREILAAADDRPRLLMLSPRGRPFDQTAAEDLSASRRLVFLCGRYEGFDERVAEILEPEEISIGDYILGGGEVAAMVVIEAVSRLVPGVVGDPESVSEDSFTNGLLDYPCYTRPPEVEGRAIPEILRSGNHGAIRDWRLRQSVELAVTRRPDLVKKNWARYSGEVRDLIRAAAPELAHALDTAVETATETTDTRSP